MTGLFLPETTSNCHSRNHAATYDKPALTIATKDYKEKDGGARLEEMGDGSDIESFE